MICWNSPIVQCFMTIKLPSASDKHYRAIRQRVMNSARSIRASNQLAPGGYVPLAMLQGGVSELVRVYGPAPVAGLLKELAGELDR